MGAPACFAELDASRPRHAEIKILSALAQSKQCIKGNLLREHVITLREIVRSSSTFWHPRRRGGRGEAVVAWFMRDTTGRN